VVGVEGEDAKRLERLSEARGKYAAAVAFELLRERSTPPHSGIRTRSSTGAALISARRLCTAAPGFRPVRSMTLTDAKLRRSASAAHSPTIAAAIV